MLRSTFFYNRLRNEGYFDLFLRIRQYSSLEGAALNWSKRKDWGIGEEAWNVLASANIAPEWMFVHPKTLQLNPSFLKYYRSVAMIPQKGLMAMSGISNVEKIESGKVEAGKIAADALKKLVSTINEVSSLVVDLSSHLSEKEIEGMMFATAGTKIDGSWRNSIGEEGERVVRLIIFDGLCLNKEIATVKDRKNAWVKVTDANCNDMRGDMAGIKELNLVNGYSVLFSSDPDVTFYGPSGEIVGVIEIKAGIDPAGALERLGAMEKSFTNTLDEYPDAVTILVASCITEEMEKRLGASMLVRQKFITSQITSSGREQRKFVNHLRKILHLTKR